MTEDPIAGFRRIRITWERGVTRLHLNRPERRNAIDLRLAQELLRASLLERTASSGCVLLTGAGEHFCVGGDLKAFEAADDLPSHLMEVTSYLHAALSRFAAMPAPLVVAARGHVAGAGLGLACLADVLLTDEHATFRSAYGALGLTPDASTSHLLPRLVGLRRAQHMTLLGHVLTAEEADRWGLSTETVASGELDKRALEVAENLAAGPTTAYGQTKRLLRSSFARSLTDHLEDESVTLSAVAGTADAVEGVSAFSARRTARFGVRA
ncbi:2-(1,2-epoxy-1,2-dihydrophenyl)acetyl-CoA isomerase [Streptomyces sp. 2132.2]|uniref:enoyl-CoA hydratase/isomerase family protein n=1 Tax=Streptomyces TaxID=1883 RepID=UPI000F46936A|nr:MULTISPECIES: enoyl-CoA hydratase/isomerase family protein [unclassified Streptomyces]ROQ89045.1 2-(1,2-epoxy-1,2-dihydrophenyl)acetyl-CoA isomerase [Streptomyces sp. 2132.2]WSI29256.1 enoyl-CoA hydratase/isomerase family protein [Streptomyces sp. NBC_01343]